MNHLYHAEHGVYPESLDASARFENLSPAEVRKTLYFDLPYDDFKPERFLYFPQGEGDIPESTIVLATPRAFKLNGTVKRIVCEHSGSIQFMPESEFVRRIEQQSRKVPNKKS